MRRRMRSRRFRRGLAQGLIDALQADRGAQTSASRSYIHNYEVGQPVRELGLVWPMYVCALKNDEAEKFSECVCGK